MQLDLLGSAAPEGDSGGGSLKWPVDLYRRRADGALALVLVLPRGALAWRCRSYQRLDLLLVTARRLGLRQHGDPEGELWHGVEVIPWEAGAWERVEPMDVMVLPGGSGQAEGPRMEDVG